MNMSKVSQCQVTQCAYNIDTICHALAITVGDSNDPRCDTFIESSRKGGDVNSIAGVGACKVGSCRFNRSLECQAQSIVVGYRGENVDCLTFDQK